MLVKIFHSNTVLYKNLLHFPRVKYFKTCKVVAVVG